MRGQQGEVTDVSTNRVPEFYGRKEDHHKGYRTTSDGNERTLFKKDDGEATTAAPLTRLLELLIGPKYDESFFFRSLQYA